MSPRMPRMIRRSSECPGLVPFLLALLLAACGGGGGGGGPVGLGPADATVDITGRADAEAVLRGINNSSAFVESAVLDLGAGTMAASTAAVSAQTLRLRDDEADGAPAADSPDDGGVIAPQVLQACADGGTADVVETQLAIDVRFDQCSGFSYTSPSTGQSIVLSGRYDGRLRVEVSPESNSETDFIVDVILFNLEIVEEGRTSTANGTVTVDYFENAAFVRIEATTNDLSLSVDGAALSLSDYLYTVLADADSETRTGDGGVMSSGFTGLSYYRIPDNDPLIVRNGETRPSSGRLLAWGANGALVRLRAVDVTTAEISLDLDGDGSFEDVYTMSWDTLFGA